MAYSISDMRTDPSGRGTIPVTPLERDDLQQGDYLTSGLTTYVVDHVGSIFRHVNVHATVIASGRDATIVGTELTMSVPYSGLVKVWRGVAA